MKNLFYKQDLEFILGQIDTLQKEHPKAQVVYNIEQNCVQILYPLPKDFYKLSGLQLKRK